MAELGRALGLPAEAVPCGGACRRRPAVLLLDTFEAAVGLEDWLREQFVPSLPARALVVVAGRNGPGGAWRRDPGWGELLRVVALRNLGPDEARAFLRGAGIAEEQHGWTLARLAWPPARVGAARGGALAAAGGGEVGPLELGAAPDVVGRLVESFLAGVPGPRHRWRSTAWLTHGLPPRASWAASLGLARATSCSRGCGACRSWSTGRMACSRTTWRAR